VISRRLLVLFAHPSVHRSQINARLAKRAARHPQVTLVDLYGEYPDYAIDIDREQQRLCEHDVVIFMFPLYWYSTPAILKEWQDLVLEYGFAYGSDGHALSGKYFLCACTAEGPSEAFDASGYNNHSLRSLLRPLEQTASLCRMRYLPPFALFGARSAVQEGRDQAHIAAFGDLLDCLAAQPLESLAESEARTINDLLKRESAGEPGA